eukprot:CAMPEP_0113550826 /NCGR_PEP_ID=MMETSP0015_2-20120614/14192_1 /TAXON_ID=2838 /ORGANISM="Odontella" /LENGTH=187 /DNA_ID=CAMNT_0000451665 /DNA_START=20 /DNA_END=583 /DNA_ORIENTATION=+ /assembly_acc=CAM_ASM_000160
MMNSLLPLLLLVAIAAVVLTPSTAFIPAASDRNAPAGAVGTRASSQPFFMTSTVPTPEESAQQLTDYMSKAHEEKLRAVADAEKKLKGRIEELDVEVSQLRGELASKSPTDGGVQSGQSYLLPATNKALAESVLKYREFVSDYLVKSQREKAKAVAAAESKLRSMYEAKIAQLEKAGTESEYAEKQP